MLLAVDAGNTNIVFALFDGGDVRARWRIATDEIAPSCERNSGGSNVAATRSRHGVERSQARSTT